MTLEIDAVTEIAGGLLDGLNDLGRAIGARRLAWLGIFAFWVLMGVAGISLWSHYARFFDTSPGWAVLSAGLWFILLVVTLGAFVTRARWAITKPPS